MLLPATIIDALPPTVPGIGGAALTAFQIFAASTSFSTEVNPSTTAQYSKFAQLNKNNTGKETMVKSRNGMTLIYLPAFLASSLIYSNIIPNSPVSSLAALFLVAHFFKRLFEVFFIHKYSGTVSLTLSSIIGIYYALVTTLICFVANPIPDVASVQIGSGIFTIGLAGNLYHHYLLANLRKTKSADKKYIAPRGGLFNFVAAPHYLFELMAWLGIAIVSQHTNAYLVFATMTSYLSGRSVAQNNFNKEQFSDVDWPADRKNIVPFLF